MDRIAFTIILNGKHHLLHNDYYKFILKNFKYWVIVEGASNNTGSTSWCHNFPETYHKNGKSIDGTNEFLHQIKKEYPNLIFIEPNGLWKNKDQQVNRCIDEVKKITNSCFLWEIDIDEQWTVENLIKSEQLLKNNNGKTGAFLCEYYVGKNLIAKGEWGEGYILPYRRLWDWKGEYFESHEPPNLKGGNGLGLLLPTTFKHYSYYFKQDVAFKDLWYTGQEGILKRWENLQNEIIFPIHISKLLGTNTHWGNSNTLIIRI